MFLRIWCKWVLLIHISFVSSRIYHLIKIPLMLFISWCWHKSHAAFSLMSYYFHTVLELSSCYTFIALLYFLFKKKGWLFTDQFKSRKYAGFCLITSFLHLLNQIYLFIYFFLKSLKSNMYVFYRLVLASVVKGYHLKRGTYFGEKRFVVSFRWNSLQVISQSLMSLESASSTGVRHSKCLIHSVSTGEADIDSSQICIANLHFKREQSF